MDRLTLALSRDDGRAVAQVRALFPGGDVSVSGWGRGGVRVDLWHGWDFGKLEQLANILAAHNARLYRDRPDLPGVYDSGVIYRIERGELWVDAAVMTARGREDCDSLAAARAGELIARGTSALLGDEGVDPSSSRASLDARVRFVDQGDDLRHAVTVLRLERGASWLQDDPSARLGMMHGLMDRAVLDNWRRRGLRPLLLDMETAA